MINIEERVSAFLLPGEQIRWTSRNNSALYTYLSMIFGLCGIYSVYFYTMITIKHFSASDVKYIEFMLLLTAVIGVLVFFYLRQMNYYLIVTNKRVIKFCARFQIEWRSIDINSIKTCIAMAAPEGEMNLFIYRRDNVIIVSSLEEDKASLARNFGAGATGFVIDPPEIVFYFFERLELETVHLLIESLRETYVPNSNLHETQEQFAALFSSAHQYCSAEIEPYLAVDEKICWAGKPAPWKVFTYYDILLGLLFWLCCPSFINYLKTNWQMNPFGVVIVACIIILAILYIIIERYVLQSFRRRQSLYVVTDRNLLIINKGSQQPVIRIPLTALTKVSFTYMFPSIGTIRFRGSPREIIGFTNIGYAAYDMLYTRLIQQPYFNFAFYDIESVSTVAKIIELARKIPQQNEAEFRAVAVE